MIIEIKDTPVPIKIWAKDLEDEALKQARETAGVPNLYPHLALMADAHAGKGSTVGSVIAMRGAIIPSCVGVDIGCGVSFVRLPINISDIKDLAILRHSFERSIPVGFQSNHEVSDRAGKYFSSLGLPSIYDQENKEIKRAALQMGTLGGGNHAIELVYDQDGNAGLLLHTGSRHIGLVIAEKHISIAAKAKQVAVSNKDLSCLLEGTEEFEGYIKDMSWALEYARLNREEIILRLLKDISHHQHKDFRYLEQKGQLFSINCHHNFASKENHYGEDLWVVRKGAVRARKDEVAIILGSMGTASYIVKGLGNKESFETCSHGAGRRMSRTKAKKTFTVEDAVRQTSGIECRKDKGILDEVPGAYKDIEEVMNNQADLVSKVFKLKQVLCIKG